MVWDSIWDQVFASGRWGKYPNEELVRFVARNFYAAPIRSAIKILEVGCGPGGNLWYLAKEGFAALGIDGSSVAIDQARKLLDESVPNWDQFGRLLVGDVKNIPLPDGSMDAVIDNECVYSNRLDDSKLIYWEIARVLRPGGLLFVRTFADGTWGEGTGTRVEEDTWECAVGPTSGKGLLRLTRAEGIPALLGDLKVTHLELSTLTCENRSQTIREWIIYAVKQP
jgi:SAM-dependent methyltransferase